MCNELCFYIWESEGSTGRMGNRCAVVLTHRVVQGGGKNRLALRRAAWGVVLLTTNHPWIQTASAVLPALGDCLFPWQGPCGQPGSPRMPSPSSSVLPPLVSASGLGAGTPAKAQLQSKISVDKPGPALMVGEIFIVICSAFSTLCRCSALMGESCFIFLPPK